MAGLHNWLSSSNEGMANSIIEWLYVMSSKHPTQEVVKVLQSRS